QSLLIEEAESFDPLERGELGLQARQFLAEERHYGRCQQQFIIAAESQAVPGGNARHVLRMGHDQSADELAAVPDDQRLLDIKAALQCVFQGCASHILAVRENQDLLAAARDGDVSSGVHAAQVAGVQPAVLIACLASGGFVLIIAEHHVRPAREDLAIFTDPTSTPSSGRPTEPIFSWVYSLSVITGEVS